ncbi:hypothetical protein ACIPY3_00325 [Paenarthrobacter sp. NPDC089714]
MTTQAQPNAPERKEVEKEAIRLIGEADADELNVNAYEFPAGN